MIQEADIRPYLGAYINLSRHNLFTTLKFINDLVGVSGGIDENEAQIWKMSILSQGLAPEQEMQARRLFFLHFPFLKYLASDKENLTIPFEQIRGRIKAFADVLSWWRNIYSHAQAIENTSKMDEFRRLRRNEEVVSQFLAFVTTVSARIIKERYSSKNKTQEGMLAPDSLEFLSKNRYKPSRNATGERLMTLDERHFTYPMMHGSPLPDGKNPERLSLFGKIQMICLFLEKKYITEFLSQIQFLADFSDETEPPRLSQRRLVLDTLSALRIRLPESRLHSEKEEIQVALDILGELKKCPSEIYELLSAKDKAEFSILASNGETVLLKRNSDRFIPLALSFLDTTCAFRDLRFQVNAGVFRYLFKENKFCLDGQSRIRVLQEPLNGFGRIQEVEKKRSSEQRDIWRNYKILGFEDSPRNDVSCLPYISDVYTRYVINGDNIGMRLDGDYLPEITLMEDGVHYAVPCRQADCTISRYAFPALLFYHLIRPMAKGNTEPVESLIEKAVTSYRKFFLDISEGRLLPASATDSEDTLAKSISESYGIRTNEIPDKLKEYLFGKGCSTERFEKHKKALLREMIGETQRRLDRINEQKRTVEKDLNSTERSDNKPGKKGYIQIKPGNMASYLAKDIVFFQEGTNKLTGLNYTVLQASIATFSPDKPNGKNELMKVFKNAGLIAPDGSAGTHPFLNKAMSSVLSNRTLDLYIDYLEAKIQFLSNPISDNASFLHSERVRWARRDTEYYKVLAKRYSEQPIALTGSIFESPVKEILLGLKNPYITEALNSGYCNMAYMIQLYQSYILEDGPQCFYGLSEGDMVHDQNHRFYSVVRKYRREAQNIIRGLKKDSVYYRTLSHAIKWVDSHPEQNNKKGRQTAGKNTSASPAEIIRSAYNEMTETEKLIRRLATQDTVLFMAASACLKKIWGLPKKDSSMKLYQIGRSDEPSVLDRRLPKVVKTVRFDWKDSTKNEDPLLHKNVAVEVEDVCVKDYGDIYRLINDRRAASLVHHLGITSIKAEELKEELDGYDNRRVGVFKDLFEYENRVLKSASQVPESPDFNAVQELDLLHTSEEKVASRLIRNSFCHNFYPTKVAYSKGVPKVVIYDDDIPKVASSMANKISDLNKQKNGQG